MNNPEYIEVKGRRIKINTSYKVALRCNEISMDNSISDLEKTFAILYLLYGDEGLNDINDCEELMRLAIKYLSCNQENEVDKEEPDMDFKQDWNLIRASFKSDYGINLNEEDLHWWDFYTYLNGLREDCVLNRIRELRTYDTSSIKDVKEKNRLDKAKKRFALKKEINLTKKQQENVENFYKLTGIKRKE